MPNPFKTDLIPLDIIINNIRILERLNDLPKYPELRKQDIHEIIRYQNWILGGCYI